ncbi:hypothetical protein OHC33_009494 [Knufia fluminis]|uniref:Heterokaryon incompatibility domain-containing protein n=1 Tax=Knufia fluminis TaxID=191047 RepID=A0AAN8ELK1_9EURO|nr:hypothetical protein OHC33_009494 [Knufia fluminis]
MPGQGFAQLERTPDDIAADLNPIWAPGGPVVHLTARQMDIMNMPPPQKQHVPHLELVELGKMLMAASQSSIDDTLRGMDANPEKAPEFIQDPFEYTPLAKPTSIRLIRLLLEDENGMLQIVMDEYDLDEHIPSYFCLSYCWDNPHAISNTFNHFEKYAEDYDSQNVYPIACNGRLIYVRANLYDALQQLPDAPGLQLKQWYTFNGQKERVTDLQVAAADGDLALVKTNLFRGAHIDARDSAGRTALTFAAVKGHASVVRTLLEAGANARIRDQQGLTCLDHALTYERHKIADLLLTFDESHVKPYRRKHKHLGRGTKLWIDAICINQLDNKEKSVQVGMMNRIYSQASFATIWLGKDDGHAALASQTIEKLFAAAGSRHLGESNIVPYRNSTPEVYAEAGVPYISSREWISLAALYLRQNFSRLWCLQETVLQDDVVMYMGSTEIPFHEFLMVTEQLHILQQKFAIPPSAMFRPFYNAPIEAEAHLISELRMRESIDDASEASRRAWFKDTKRFWRGEGKQSRIPLFDMIISTITFNCFDPRDHVYALIGMCKNHPESPEIVVDYDKPFEEVYTDIMRLMLQGIRDQEQPDLQLVACIKDSANKQNENLPSWVIHFAQPGISPFWMHHYSAAESDSETFDSRFSSSGRQHELVVQGKRIDVVEHLATRRAGHERVTMFDFDPNWPALILHLPQIYPHSNQPRTEVLWRTVCADSTATEDIVRAKQARSEHIPTSSTTAGQGESWETTAPIKYGSQFRDQLCAMILAHAERAADFGLSLKLSRGGVLLQALMSLQLQDSGAHVIETSTKEEIAQIMDTSLTGPYFASPAMQQALAELEALHQADDIEAGGPGCATPSLDQIAAYLEDPKWRVWRKTVPPGDPAAVSHTTADANRPEHASDSQAMDELPPGEDGFRAQFSRYNGGRRLFVTGEKQYLGLGAMSMEVGDEVWVVKGSKVPFLLRKISEEEEEEEDEDEDTEAASNKDKNTGSQRRRTYYKYIGDLYVHGIMHGEAVDDAGELETVVLI